MIKILHDVEGKVRLYTHVCSSTPGKDTCKFCKKLISVEKSCSETEGLLFQVFVKANKQINIYLSKYAKDKLYKELVKKGYELTFLIKKELVKADIIQIEDLSY